jgi:hypothetical protein
MGPGAGGSVSLAATSIELLLDLLEAETPVIGGLAALHHQEDVDALRRHGLLHGDGKCHAAIIPIDDDDQPAEVFTMDPGGPLVAFDPISGLVHIQDDEVQRWRLDVDAVLKAFTEHLDLGGTARPMELVPGLLWEIGMMRLGQRPIRHPLWFVRQLGIRQVQQTVTEAATIRAHASHRILLTSTARDWVEGFSLPGATVISVGDVLEREGALPISAEIVRARVSGVTQSATSGPVELSDDNRILMISGTAISLRSERHRDAVRLLVNAYRGGRRLHVKKIIGPDSGSRSLDQFFGARLFKQIKPFLRHGGGQWWLEL